MIPKSVRKEDRVRAFKAPSLVVVHAPSNAESVQGGEDSLPSGPASLGSVRP